MKQKGDLEAKWIWWFLGDSHDPQVGAALNVSIKGQIVMLSCAKGQLTLYEDIRPGLYSLISDTSKTEKIM